MVKELGKKVIAQNKSARHDYFIEEVYECGLVLTGTEVKSLRAGRASLTDGYAMAKDGEIWVSGIHIPEYNQGSWIPNSVKRGNCPLRRAVLSPTSPSLHSAAQIFR